MQIFPAIDLRGGQVVRLYQGDYDQETVYAQDPCAVARDFLAAGAKYLHVVDLDGALDGTLANTLASIAYFGNSTLREYGLPEIPVETYKSLVGNGADVPQVPPGLDTTLAGVWTANDYLTQVQLNAFIRAFGGIGFDYAILAMKIGLFGQLSFQGAVRFLNAIGEAQAKVGYKIDFLGEVGIEFLIKFLFITYERVLWSQKIQIPSIQDNNWDAIEKATKWPRTSR